MAAPSVLKEPRFFDDACHSEWRTNGVVGTAPAERLNSKPLATGPVQPEWVPPEQPGEPIGIELVKGAHGPTDDSWSVLVDGLHATNARDTENVMKCQLPPPVPADESVTVDTVVRPVVIAVRLNDEARRPAKVQLVVQQVCTSDERALYGGDDEVVEISRIDIETYRPCDASVPSVTAPYPFRAPAQSAVGIVSYKHVEKWDDDLKLANAHNVGVEARYVSKSATYKARELYNQSVKASNLQKDASYSAQAFAPGRMPGRPTFGKLWKLPQKAPTLGAQRSIGERPTDTEAHYVIAGRRESAPRVMADLFKDLTNVCEDSREDDLESDDAYLLASDGTRLNNKGRSLRHHIDAMRAMLYDKDKYIAKIFLEALLGSNPLPMTRMLANYPAPDGEDPAESAFARRKWTVACAGKGTTTPDDKLQTYTVERATAPAGTSEDLANLQEVINQDYKKLEEQRTSGKGEPVDASYEFMYERLSLEARARSSIRMRLRIEVTEMDGTKPFVVEIENLSCRASHGVFRDEAICRRAFFFTKLETRL